MQRLRQRLVKLDARIYKIERIVVGVLFLVMALVVFLDVVHRVFSRVPGRLAILFAGPLGTTAENLDSVAAPVFIGATLLALTYAALRTRAGKTAPSRVRTLFTAALFTAIATTVVQAYVLLMPDGVVWAPYLALSILLWIGLVGASLATYAGRHLAMEMGEKLWPKRLRTPVRVTAQLVTASFCSLIVVLGSISLADHFSAWQASPRADLLPSVDLPKWIVFAVVPYAFAMMAGRFLGHATGFLPTPKPEDTP